MSDYRMDRIARMRFDSTDMPEFFVQADQHSRYRLTEGQLKGLPPGADIDALRRTLAAYFDEKLSASYAQLEARCDIYRDTFQKILRFKGGRNVTYRLLAKFCIGAGVSIEEAKQLFEYMDYHLSERSLADYILLCNLHNGCSIDEYLEDMAAHGLQG